MTIQVRLVLVAGLSLLAGAVIGYSVRAAQRPRWQFIRQSADAIYRVQPDTGYTEITYGDGNWHPVK